MRRNDLMSSLFFSVVGLLIMAGSLGMPVGRLGEPGPGFLPLIVGILLVVISGIVFRQSLKSKVADQKVPGLDRKQLFKVLTMCLALILYAVALKPLGFVLVTFLLIVFLFRAIGNYQWKVSIAGAILITLCFYLLFKVWLEVQFPMGPFGT